MRKVAKAVECKYCSKYTVVEMTAKTFTCQYCNKKQRRPKDHISKDHIPKGPLIQKGYTDELGIYRRASSSPKKPSYYGVENSTWI